MAWQDGGTGASAAAVLESSLPVLPKFAWLEVFGHMQRGFQGNSPELDFLILLSPSSSGTVCFATQVSVLRTTTPVSALKTTTQISVLRTMPKPTLRCFGESVTCDM